MERLEIAVLGKSFGVKGQLHAFSKTSFPQTRLKKGYVYEAVSPDGKNVLELTLHSFSINGEEFILGFEGISNPEEASKLARYSLCMDKQDAPMPEGYVRYGEMIGMKAYDENGKEIGTLDDVLQYSPTPSLRFIGVGKKPFHVPFIDEFVKQVDYENKTMVIHVVEGML